MRGKSRADLLNGHLDPVHANLAQHLIAGSE